MVAFPAEVLRLIFAHLSQEERYTCMRVCKSWYPEASAIQYKILLWSTKYTARHVQLVTKTRVDGSKLGDFVRKFYAHGIETTSNITAMDFLQLILSLPHLQLMDMVRVFMPYLNIIPQDMLANLQEISMSSGEMTQQDMTIHFLTNVRFKSQITTLKLRGVSLFFLNHIYAGLLTLLSEFKILQNLDINCYDENGVDNRVECINVTNIINCCKSLVSLNLASRYNWIIRPVNNSINTSLVSLNLKVPLFKQEHMAYTMQHLPNVKEFRVGITSQCLENVLNTSNKSVVENFAAYLQKMTHVEIKSSKRYIRNERGNALLASIQNFWDFVRRMSSERCCHNLNATLLASVEKFHAGAHIVRENQNVAINCHLLYNSNPRLIDDQLKGLTWQSIKMTLGDNGLYADAYSCLFAPIIHLLKQQQQVCSLNICGQICFNLQPLRPVKAFANWGRLQKIIIRDVLLKELAEVYSTVEDLEFDQCTLETNKNNAHIYQINLTHFKKFATKYLTQRL